MTAIIGLRTWPDYRSNGKGNLAMHMVFYIPPIKTIY